MNTLVTCTPTSAGKRIFTRSEVDPSVLEFEREGLWRLIKEQIAYQLEFQDVTQSGRTKYRIVDSISRVVEEGMLP